MSGRSVNPLADALKSLQIMVVAMTFGCFCFLVFAMVFFEGQGKVPEQPLVTYFMLAMAASVVIARIIVPRILVAQARQNIRQGRRQRPPEEFSSPQSDSAEQTKDAAELLAVFRTQLIVSAALLEGAAFSVLVAYLLEQSIWSLATAVVLIVGVAVQFPTLSYAAAWIEKQTQRIEEERLLN